MHPEPIGGTVDAIRAELSWLGKCSREQAGHSMHLVFEFRPEIDAQATLGLKVEINIREHAPKTDVRIIDFLDIGHPALRRMWASASAATERSATRFAQTRVSKEPSGPNSRSVEHF